MDDAVKERLLDQLRHYFDGIEVLEEPPPIPPARRPICSRCSSNLPQVRNDQVRTRIPAGEEGARPVPAACSARCSRVMPRWSEELKRAQADAHEERGPRRCCTAAVGPSGAARQAGCDAAIACRVAAPGAGWAAGALKPTAPEDWREGLGNVTSRRLGRILAERRVSRIDLAGTRFDPRLARAVGTFRAGRPCRSRHCAGRSAGRLLVGRRIAPQCRGDRQPVGRRRQQIMTDEIVGIDLGTTNSRARPVPRDEPVGDPGRRAGPQILHPRWWG